MFASPKLFWSPTAMAVDYCLIYSNLDPVPVDSDSFIHQAIMHHNTLQAKRTQMKCGAENKLAAIGKYCSATYHYVSGMLSVEF